MTAMAGEQLVLASASPRRAELLRQLGVAFEIAPAEIDETPRPAEKPADYVQRMAREKAAACLRQRSDSTLPVLAADTTVVLDEQILGKPADRLDALATLARLSGREHVVYTAICLRLGTDSLERLSETRVQFLTLDRDQVEAYIDTGEPFDKAGAYGIQGLAAAFVESISGSYSGVVGLPLAETWQLLQRVGIHTALEGASGE